MTGLFGRSGHPRRPLTPVQRQFLDGWIRMLDVDVELAQTTLRLGDRRLPCPPLELPAVIDHHGVIVAPVVPAPTPDDTPATPPVSTGLRGAYARRARKA